MNRNWFDTLATLCILGLTAFSVWLMIEKRGEKKADCGCKGGKTLTPAPCKNYSGSALGKKVM
jgi:hypothetical protein